MKKAIFMILCSAIFLFAKPPLAPLDLKVSQVTQTSVYIRWRDAASNEKGYKIYRKIKGKTKTYRLIATLPPNSTFYEDTRLLSDTIYEYKVVAFNDEGESKAAYAEAKTLKPKSYTFTPTAIFEIEQNDPYTMHVEIAADTCSAIRRVVLKTGQTTSYYAHDDGAYQKGAARSYTRDNAKEIVKDNTTGLMWQDNSDAKTITKTWDEAKAYCENLTLGGYDDWRLPTERELLSIVDYGRYNPAIDPTFVNVVSGGYWSSTTVAFDSSYAWAVFFYVGGGYWHGKSVSYYVRCVRAGQ